MPPHLLAPHAASSAPAPSELRRYFSLRSLIHPAELGGVRTTTPPRLPRCRASFSSPPKQ
uniref:Uncharacterized protein n=1 Tax=Oryza meridionalis TaxID=40149 RepID=A0A0E0CJW4_9ORYZ